QQVGQRQELANDLADRRRAAQAATDQHLKADVALPVAPQVQTDVVHFRGRPISGGSGHGNLELAGQIGELGMQRGPLANDFTVGTRIVDLVLGYAGEVVRGDVPDAVAAGLDGMHLYRGKLGENVRHVLELRPVELQILPGREVSEAAIVAARDI